jgi:hypothetical protein
MVRQNIIMTRVCGRAKFLTYLMVAKKEKEREER